MSSGKNQPTKRKLRSVDDVSMPERKMDQSMRDRDLRGFRADGDYVAHDFGEAMMVDADMAGADLSESDLSRTQLVRANLSECVLQHTALPCDLRGVNLSYNDLRGHDFGVSDLTGANLEGCWLAGADMSRCRMGLGTSLRKVDLQDVRLPASMSLVDLTHADLRGCALACDLTLCSLDYADLRGADLTRCALMGTTFVGAQLEHAKLSVCLKWAVLNEDHGMDLSRADVRQARFLSRNIA
jgi:uncharacterized protein YjbI with pentapeptide repeats